jgi:DNA polymerase-3 subunit epsilon
VNNAARTLHGALLDAEILADVFLAMTGGQTTLGLHEEQGDTGGENVSEGNIRRLPPDRPALPIIAASEDELANHAARLNAIGEASGGRVLWRDLEPQ